MLRNEVTLFIWPNSPCGEVCAELLQLLCGAPLKTTGFETEQDLINAVSRASSDSYDYCTTDVLWDATDKPELSNAAILQLQMKLRNTVGPTALRHYGWAGQLIVLGGNAAQSAKRGDIWPFNGGFGLKSIPTTVGLPGLLHCLHDRKPLHAGRWQSAMRNLPGLQDFWTQMRSANEACERNDWESAKERLRCAVEALLSDDDSESYFGHDLYRYLMQVREACLAACDNSWIVSTLGTASNRLQSFHANDPCEEFRL